MDWQRRYSRVISILGKDFTIEELMLGLTKDIQSSVNHPVARSANSQQTIKLEEIIKETESIMSSSSVEKSSAMNFNSGGGSQTNNVNPGSGQQINNNGSVTMQNSGSGWK